MAETFVVETHSPEETERLGCALGGLLPCGAVVALRGELAAGKTCLVRGLARRFADEDVVSSPTFTLVNQYGDSPRLYHVDLYRLHSVDELGDLGYEDLFDPDGVCVIEWAERAEALLPEKRVDVFMEHVGEGQRRIEIADGGVLPTDWQRIIGRYV